MKKKSPKTKTLNIGYTLKMVRLAKGMTQQHVSDLTGIARPNIARVESDRHAATLETVLVIANALEIDIKKLFTHLLNREKPLTTLFQKAL